MERVLRVLSLELPGREEHSQMVVLEIVPPVLADRGQTFAIVSFVLRESKVMAIPEDFARSPVSILSATRPIATAHQPERA
jgi:hypothetical protein